MQHVEKERRPNHQNQYCAALRSYCLSCFTPQFNNSILIYAVRWHQIWNMKFSCSYKKNGFPELSDKGCCRNWSETVSWSLISLVLCPRSGVKDCFELLMEKRWSKKRVVCVMCVIRCCPPLSHTHTHIHIVWASFKYGSWSEEFYYRGSREKHYSHFDNIPWRLWCSVQNVFSMWPTVVEISCCKPPPPKK